jgi:hypothetical protein
LLSLLASVALTVTISRFSSSIHSAICNLKKTPVPRRRAMRVQVIGRVGVDHVVERHEFVAVGAGPIDELRQTR